MQSSACTRYTAANKSTCADSEPIAPDQHKVYWKLQWLSFTRSRLEESKTATQIPTWNKQLHTTTPSDNNSEHKRSSPRYGCTRGRRLGRMPIYTPEHNRVLNLHPRNTSELRFLNASYIIALSSAESELYAICTRTSEGLHLKMFLQESGLASKASSRTHTDSTTAGKSIATRQGTAKKAKQVDIFLYTQQLTKTASSASTKSTRQATLRHPSY